MNLRFVNIISAALLLFATQIHATPLRITSWDLQPSAVAGTNGYSAQYQRHLMDEAAETLRKLNPDVILLQQVVSQESCEQLAKALKPENYTVATCSTLHDAHTGVQNRGQVAILTKARPFVAVSEPWQSNAQISASPGGFAFAAIRVGDKNIGFYAVQLSDGSVADFEKDSNFALQWAREESARQLVLQINFLRNWNTNHLQAEIVAGDFNTSLDDTNFVQEKTVSRLEQAGFENAFAGLPLEKRVTLPGNGKRPDATVDYLFSHDAGLVSNLQITQAALTEHAAITSDVDFNPPKNLPAAATVATISPATKTETTAVIPTNHPAAPPKMVRANSTATKFGIDWWRTGALAVAGLIVSALFGWLCVRWGRRKPDAANSKLLPVEQTAVVTSTAQPIVRVEVEGVTQVPSLSSAGALPSIVESAPARVAALPEPVRQSLVAQLSQWLKTRFVQRLVSDRAQLLETQQAAALRLLSMEERLAQIERQVQERNREYEHRIEALLKELAEAREENRELIRAKIALLKAEMEKNARLRAAKE